MSLTVLDQFPLHLLKLIPTQIKDWDDSVSLLTTLFLDLVIQNNQLNFWKDQWHWWLTKLSLIHQQVLEFIQNIVYHHSAEILVNLRAFWTNRQVLSHIMLHWYSIMMMNFLLQSMVHFLSMLQMHILNIFIFYWNSSTSRPFKKNDKNFSYTWWSFSIVPCDFTPSLATTT